jgi:hypothetical protein
LFFNNNQITKQKREIKSGKPDSACAVKGLNTTGGARIENVYGVSMKKGVNR